MKADISQAMLGELLALSQSQVCTLQNMKFNPMPRTKEAALAWAKVNMSESCTVYQIEKQHRHAFEIEQAAKGQGVPKYFELTNRELVRKIFRISIAGAGCIVKHDGRCFYFRKMKKTILCWESINWLRGVERGNFPRRIDDPRFEPLFDELEKRGVGCMAAFYSGTGLLNFTGTNMKNFGPAMVAAIDQHFVRARKAAAE